MEVARTEVGYYVGVSGCPGRTWATGENYSDPFVPRRGVLNLRPTIAPVARGTL